MSCQGRFSFQLDFNLIVPKRTGEHAQIENPPTSEFVARQLFNVLLGYHNYNSKFC